MASAPPIAPSGLTKGIAETPSRRLSLPIPKRRGPCSRNDHLHSMYDGVYGQFAGLPGQARKYFCAVSPSHSSDASTIDECEEGPVIRGPSECQPGVNQYVSDITSLYVLGQLIGIGSQSFVYHCRWTERAASLSVGPLCIKHIVGDSSREALTAACQVVHPNVARHFATYDDWRGLWVLMEYVQGTDLAAYLQRVGRLSPKASMQIFRQIICALECIHAHNLVHQDVKLENIVVRETPKPECSPQERAPDVLRDTGKDVCDVEVVLVDFGSAEVVPANQRMSTKPESSPAGTAMYMAPEAFLETPVDYKSDIWSAGILLCLLLSGRSPFEGQTIMHTLGHARTALTNASRTEKHQTNALRTRLSIPTEECRERKRRPLQQEEFSRGFAPHDFIKHSADTASDSFISPAGPEAVRDRLMEAFSRPEWDAVPAEAKELISEMLTVDTSLRPSAAKIMQSTWLMSP